MWEVQHKTEVDGWVNTWRYDDDSFVLFDTYQEALGELIDFFEGVLYAAKEGAMSEDHGYRPEDFRIVWVEEMMA